MKIHWLLASMLFSNGLMAAALPHGYKKLIWGTALSDAQNYLTSNSITAQAGGDDCDSGNCIGFNEESGNEITLNFTAGKLDQYSVTIENLPNPLLSSVNPVDLVLRQLKKKYGKPISIREISDDYQGTTFWQATWRDRLTVAVLDFSRGGGEGVNGLKYIARSKVDEQQRKDEETDQRDTTVAADKQRKSLNGL